MSSSTRTILIVFLLAVVLAVIIFFVVRSSKQTRMQQDMRDMTSSFIELEDVGLAQVDQVSIEILESFPLQARAVANGRLPDQCTLLGEPIVSYSDLDKEFIIELMMQRPTNTQDCPAGMQTFSEIIPLPINGFEAGEYRVAVNGVATSFELITDNSIDFELDKG